MDRGTIIISSRNNLHLTKKAVASALKQDYPCDVLLVDNASSDGTVEWANTKDIAMIAYQQQQSLAHCWNTALRFTFAHSEHAMVVNNDVELRSDSYRLLLKHGGLFVTCVSVDIPERMGVHGDRRMEELRRSERPNPDYSCWLMRKAAWEAVQFREEFYPCWHEDNSHHVDLHRAGIKAVCIDLPFLHHGSSTIKHADPAERAELERGFSRTKQRFFELYGCYPGTPEYDALFR